MLAATAVITSPIGCHGGQAVVSVTASGGTASYTGTGNFNVSAGTYTYPISDTNGCSAQAVITINEPTPINVSATLTSLISCNGGQGQVTVIANGGTPSYASGIGIFPVTAGPNQVFTVVDTNGCTGSDTITITQPSLLSASVVQNNPILCHGDTTTVTVTASGGTPNYSGIGVFAVTVGTHTFVVTDANGCEDSVTITITQPNALSVSATPQQITCFGLNNGSISPAVSGGTPGYTYSWLASNGGIPNPSSTVIPQTGLVPGDYALTVTDSNGCTISGSWTINAAPPLLTLSLTPIHPVCFNETNGSISAVVNGGTPGYSLSGSPTQVGLTNTYIYGSLGSGSYTVTVTDTNGCVQTQNVVLNNPAQLLVSATSTPASCNGGNDGTIIFTATGGTGGLNYSTIPATGSGVAVSGISDTIFGVSAGIYQVLVVDGNGCQDTLSVVVNEPDSLLITETITQISCNGANDGGISITPSGGAGGYTYGWTSIPAGYSSSNGSISSLVPGTYVLLLTDGNGCTATETYTINEPPALNLQATVTSLINCFGQTGSITATVTGGTANYTLTGIGAPQALTAGSPSHIYTGLVAGTYTLTVTDSLGCTDQVVVVLTQPNLLTLSASSPGILCHGGTASVTLTPSGGTPSYTYSGSSTSGLVPDTYSYTVTDANSCTANTTITITQPSALAVTAVVSTAIPCSGGQGVVTVSAVGGTLAYSGTGNFTVSAGTHTFPVTDGNGCTDSDMIMVTQPNPLVATASVVSTIDCNGGQATVSVIASGGTPSYTGIGNFNVSAGTYPYTITDANACTATTSATITEPLPILLTGSVNGNNIDISVSGGTVPYNYSWSNGAVTQDLPNVLPGTYVVIVTDAFNCSISDTFTVDNAGLEQQQSIELQVFPNPAQGLVTIHSSSAGIGNTYRILDCYGRNVAEGKLQTAETTFSIQALANGVYHVKCGSVTRALVISH